MTTNFQRDLFQLSFEISPIILTNGIASTLGNYLPIIALTEPANFTQNLLNGKNPLNLNQFFAHFKPVAGSTLIDNEIGMYPFANSAIASNAIITQPKSISMLMQCPANKSGSYVAKLLTFMLLKQQLEQHCALGGTFIVATPAYVYTDCILKTMTDVTPNGTKQIQTAYQLDFIQPLITLNQAQQVLNSLTSKITQGLPTSTSLSSAENTLQTPVTLLTPNGSSGAGFSGSTGSLANPNGSGNTGTGTETMTININGVGGY